MEGGAVGTILKATHPGTIPAMFGVICLSGFREEELNVIFYQNMPNLNNRYKSVERKIKVYDVRRTDGRTDKRTDGRRTMDAK